MEPLTERVFEDAYWLVILMAMIAFFWFHNWDNRKENRSKMKRSRRLGSVAKQPGRQRKLRDRHAATTGG
jgi:hypothetical protein